MKKRGSDNCEVPISSLIDVVFLLIMFFVVTSDISKEAYDVNVDLVKAKNMKPATMPPLKIILNIKPNFSNPNKADIYVGSGLVTLEALRSILNGFGRNNSAGVVIIRADKNVLFEAEAEVIEAIKASGLRNVNILAELKGK